MGPRKELHEVLMKRIRRNSELAGVTFATRDGQFRWKTATVLPVWSASTTRRAVARQLGQLLWFLRVYEIDFLDEEAFLRIFKSRGLRYGGMGEVVLSVAEQQTLRLEWKEWEVGRWASRRTAATPTKWVWVATDATPTSTAAFMFTTGPRLLCSACHLDLGEDTQVQREMEAIAMGIGLVARGEGCIIATDAESCLVALEKGKSASLRIVSVFGSFGKVAVRTPRVAGTDNPADESSHDRELEVHKLQRLIPLFNVT